MATLEISNLSKDFGSTKVLDDINLKAIDGEFLVLVGPSGSGKSTILRIIAGLEQATSGEIKINDKIINDSHPKDRDIAMVFQNYALYPHMNIFENLAFPLRMRSTDKTLLHKAVNETAELLGIKKYLSKKPKELSGGERQRVALGRAIIRKPQLFLMDEPLSNLDAKLRTQMRSELLKLHKTLATTVIYVTHDQIEALTMGSKIAVLNHGKIQQTDSPLNIYTKPVNTFVAGFIGNPGMNFFNVKILDSLKIELLGKVYELNQKKEIANLFEKTKNTARNITLGIRPEHISLNGNGDLNFTSHIELIEILGNEYLVYLNTKEKDNNYNFSAKIFNECSYKRNDIVNVSLNLSYAHFFDSSSGSQIIL